MKEAKISLVIATLILLFSGCRYEEGSGLSATKVEKRIRGIWTVSTVYKNGEKTDTESPTLVESKYAQYRFYKNKILLISYIQGNMLAKSDGSWRFGEKKKTLDVTLLNQYYWVSRSYEIIKFTNKELKLRFTDEDGVIWTFVLALEQSFANYEI